MFLFSSSLLLSSLFLSFLRSDNYVKCDKVVSEVENPEMITVKEVDMKLFALMDEMRQQFSLILDLLRGRSVDWIEERQTRLEVEIHKGGCLLPQLKDS